MSQALAASFNSWEKEREQYNIPKGNEDAASASSVGCDIHKLNNQTKHGILFSACLHLTDPQQWSESDVNRWLNWAIKEFNLEGVDTQNFAMEGKEMCAMGKEMFLARTPPFMGDILWEHLDRLLKGKRSRSSSVPPFTVSLRVV